MDGQRKGSVRGREGGGALDRLVVILDRPLKPRDGGLPVIETALEIRVVSPGIDLSRGRQTRLLLRGQLGLDLPTDRLWYAASLCLSAAYTAANSLGAT